ncbi:Xylosyltransferase 2 [Phlyctochytrium planicorne]|nr:Xylosyltransferase 2 [Phlyctochytrium planicorne]
MIFIKPCKRTPHEISLEPIFKTSSSDLAVGNKKNFKPSSDSKKKPSTKSQKPVADDDASNYLSGPKLLEASFSNDSNLLTALETSRHVRMTGFDYCKILNYASFDALAEFTGNGGDSGLKEGATLASVNPDVRVVTKLIDSRAKVLSGALEKYRAFRHEHVRRYACYAAADGANSFANLTSTRFLYQVDPANYLSEMLPGIRPEPGSNSTIPGPRRKYKLAYLLMVDGDESLIANIQILLDNLDDGSAIILIHVDDKSRELRAAVENLVAERDATLTNGPGNVFLAKTTYDGMWGHISLVWIQLSGYWELMDMADWEYVINLSAFDFPLRASREVYRVLNQSVNRGKIWIDYWDDDTATTSRMMRPHLARLDRSAGDFTMYHLEDIGLLYPPYAGWRMCRQHQWMILPRTYLTYLRYSKEAALALSYIEFSWLPEQSFFCYVALNTPYFAERLLPTNKRYLKYEGDSLHPVFLDPSFQRSIGSDRRNTEPRHLFMRKVDIRTQAGRDLVKWAIEEHIKRHVLVGGKEGKAGKPGRFPGYGVLGAEQWVVKSGIELVA